MVHVSELAWEFIDHPNDLGIQRGDEIEARIVSIDMEKQRVSLSRKAILPTPWQIFTEKFAENALTEGTVSSIAPFGLFVKVMSGVEGLVHESELLDGVESAVGDTVLVRITSLDSEQEQVGLSMKQVTAEEQVAWMQAQVDDESLIEGDEMEAISPSAK